MMKILIDCSFMDSTQISGVYNCTYRLLNGFKDLNDVALEIHIIIQPQEKEYFTKLFSSFTLLLLPKHLSMVVKKIPHLKGYIYSSFIDKYIVKKNIDIFFCPYMSIDSLFCSKAKQIGILHDAQTYILKKNQFVKGKIYKFFMDRILDKNKFIVTISEEARKNIQKQLPYIKAPLYLIHNSVIVSRKMIGVKDIENQKYILFVNTLMEYKNIETLIRAFFLIKDKIPHILLIKARSTEFWQKKMIPLINDLKLMNRVVLYEKNLSDEEMAFLYNKAEIFVSTSLMEGFGYTPIEAAIYKTSVITTKIPVILETSKGLFHYYEPAKDYKVLSSTIYNLLQNPDSPETLSDISKKLESLYLPVEQARKFISLFAEIRNM
ncbi:glycosyltransferase [uncultured Coprobacter sp.]|uniref:glycosyltransferase n=1 Tax=uncultured Coprobacter sp. TaxID=1720550 RepID=UPI002615B310|nr:glycosyltransferase [uncultured Coprobacter sp.]